MHFQIIPILENMCELYALPKGMQRFNHYLSLMEAGKIGDVLVPISAYNPMAGDAVRERLQELIALNAEVLADQVLQQLSLEFANDLPEHSVSLSINLADDLKGAWTNHAVTDFSNRFKTQAYLKRNICAIIFWISEQINETVIKERVLEAGRRFYWQAKYGLPNTLQQMLEQERWALHHSAEHMTFSEVEWTLHHEFFNQHQNSEDEAIHFAFFYGDEAAEKLGYPLSGLPSRPNGFDFVKRK